MLNKADLLSETELEQLVTWFKENSQADAVLPLSALNGTGVDALKEWAVSKLPLGPSLYDKVSSTSCHCQCACLVWVVKGKAKNMVM